MLVIFLFVIGGLWLLVYFMRTFTGTPAEQKARAETRAAADLQIIEEQKLLELKKQTNLLRIQAGLPPEEIEPDPSPKPDAFELHQKTCDACFSAYTFWGSLVPGNCCAKGRQLLGIK